MMRAAAAETPSCPPSESFVSALSAMVSSSRLRLRRGRTRDGRPGGGGGFLGRHLRALEVGLQREAHDVVVLRAGDEVHEREIAAPLQRADEVGDGGVSVALPGELDDRAGLVQRRQPDEVGKVLRDLVQQMDGLRLRGLQALDEVHLLLEGTALGLQGVDLDLDRLQLALALLRGGDVRVQLLDLGGLVPPEGGAQHERAPHEEGQEEVDLHRAGGDRRYRPALLRLGRPLGGEEVYADHRSPTFRAASPTAMAAWGPMSLMKSGSKSRGL